ncbi:tryptophan 2,3-dioxygenase family protein [Luteibaculum oceani]|uniref:Tryptophan 2,3-dioxygenase n=1 Tax=Luteibaculum oceani TaxID=1294296 RepID=A0A5C6VIW7_9FLAO|nr:tryptophan 2,3-dioxygenase family protein [Luteibaculum oceani]TXC85087.1 tryptophan 2,3-dioxygenase [Luteibaculum oceani]
MVVTSEIQNKLEALHQKFSERGQDLGSYLDGLLHSEFLTYWDYIHQDTLLSLQTPRTIYPDENIFIIYHQITELYFKLCLQELDHICGGSKKEKWDSKKTVTKLKRINNYFRALVHSFGIMIEGMDKEQFLKFRMALLPASGFQSVQYRKIEIHATGLENLLHHSVRGEVEITKEEDINQNFDNIYWKFGATTKDTGEKTLTLKMFEERYDTELLGLLTKLKFCNLNHLLLEGYLSDGDEEIKRQLKTFDILVNVDWPLVHYKSAVRYLQSKEKDIAATGGTNWQDYLPPHFQKRIFFPTLWTQEEKDNWGKNWVESALGLK